MPAPSLYTLFIPLGYVGEIFAVRYWEDLAYVIWMKTLETTSLSAVRRIAASYGFRTIVASPKSAQVALSSSTMPLSSSTMPCHAGPYRADPCCAGVVQVSPYICHLHAVLRSKHHWSLCIPSCLPPLRQRSTVLTRGWQVHVCGRSAQERARLSAQAGQASGVRPLHRYAPSHQYQSTVPCRADPRRAGPCCGVQCGRRSTWAGRGRWSRR